MKMAVDAGGGARGVVIEWNLELMNDLLLFKFRFYAQLFKKLTPNNFIISVLKKNIIEFNNIDLKTHS